MSKPVSLILTNDKRVCVYDKYTCTLYSTSYVVSNDLLSLLKSRYNVYLVSELNCDLFQNLPKDNIKICKSLSSIRAPHARCKYMYDNYNNSLLLEYKKMIIDISYALYLRYKKITFIVIGCVCIYHTLHFFKK